LRILYEFSGEGGKEKGAAHERKTANHVKDNRHVEVEVKLFVQDLESIAAQIVKQDGKLSKERVFERNVRYEDPASSLTPAARVLRLRQDTRARLTYKEPGDETGNGNAKVSSRTELEVEVSDFTTTDLILKKLGYVPAWIYEKYRTTYELMDCEITLDEMPFGHFVEVEGDADNIERVLSALGLADHPRITRSYSDLFVGLKQKMNLPFQDLTFDNFKGIVVVNDVFG